MRKRWNMYTSEIMLMIHKPKCENKDITTIGTSSESHLHWNKHFQKNPLYFRIYAYFEADNEKICRLWVIKQQIFINEAQYLMVIV